MVLGDHFQEGLFLAREGSLAIVLFLLSDDHENEKGRMLVDPPKPPNERSPKNYRLTFCPRASAQIQHSARSSIRYRDRCLGI